MAPPNPYVTGQVHGAGASVSFPPAQPHAHHPHPTAPAPYTVHGAAYAYAAPRTNPLAITSMILSLVSLAFVITSIAGVVLGHIALSQIRRTGEGGRGMAITGVVVGYVLSAFWLLMIAFPLIMMFAFFGVSGI